MALLKYGGRKLSFDVLNGDDDGDVSIDDQEETTIYRSVSDSFSKKRKKKSKKKKKLSEKEVHSYIEEEEQITEKRVDAVFENGVELDCKSYSIQTVICEEITVPEKDNECIRTVHQVSEKDYEVVNGDRLSSGDVRRRSRPPSGNVDESMSVANEDNVVVNGDRHSSLVEVWRRSRPPSGNVDESILVVNEANAGVKEETKTDLIGQSKLECNFGTKLEKEKSLDWRQFMKEDSDFFSVERSPVQYFMGKIYYGSSLDGTTILGSEKERERVYDAMLHLPWRCERIIAVGYLVCLDSFLSLLTIMPARILMAFWRFISTWQFWMPSAGELSDFSCFIVLVCGVTLLLQADISLIYHMIRGQGTIKLYVVYNVLEIFDKLCQNFGGDVLQTLFSSAKGLSCSLPENKSFWVWRFIADQALTIVASILHSFILLAQAITLSTCIVSHNNALLALLVSNNFAEIKSNVFKRFSKDNIHNMVYSDSIERFHISAFILFVLAQNLLEAEGPWFGSFLLNASLVFSCEILIDIIKHSFIAKFNEIKPIAYSEFLEDLCKQTLNMQPEDTKKNLTFVPLAPACVVIRVLTPVYAAHLPYGPLPWRLLWIFLLSVMTYVMLASLKVMVGMGLHKFAAWYVSRCQIRKLHSD